MAKKIKQQNTIPPDLEQTGNQFIDSVALALATIARDLYGRELADKERINSKK